LLDKCRNKRPLDLRLWRYVEEQERKIAISRMSFSNYCRRRSKDLGRIRDACISEVALICPHENRQIGTRRLRFCEQFDIDLVEAQLRQRRGEGAKKSCRRSDRFKPTQTGFGSTFLNCPSG
jgi:hypothetical protein